MKQVLADWAASKDPEKIRNAPVPKPGTPKRKTPIKIAEENEVLDPEELDDILGGI